MKMSMNTVWKRSGARALAVMALVLGMVSMALGQDKPETLKLAAYNMEWFIGSPVSPNLRLPEHVKPKPEEEITKVADCVRMMNADIVAFEEVESEDVIQSMLGKHLNDLKYRYVTVAKTNSSATGQHIGVMSKKPIKSITSYRYEELTLPGHDRKWRFARDLLKVTVQATAEKTMDVYVVHLKSKRDSGDDKNSNNYRLAEMTAIKRIIGEQLEKDPTAWVALVGDFNDTPDSPVLKLVTDKDEKTGKALLIDPHAGMPAEKRISYLKEPYRSTIDFTLLSPELAKRVVPEKSGLLANDVKDPKVLDGSDHSPIYVTIDLKK